MPVKELNFITANPNKLAEVKDILGDTVVLKSKSIDLPEIQGTIEKIALDKCRRAADITKFIAKVGGPVLIEDTALCFNALKGLPGPYIKWFLESLGHDGLNKLLFAYEDKSAQAVCTFAYCEGHGHDPIIFEGRALGIIVPARGPPRFGWDAIFEYGGETYAEMEPSKKNGLSHRYLALKKLKEWLIGHME
ncbi:nucleoside triphosphate pyrophosphohydrolase ham1 [Peltigera leucophlebia]|nr:nucleoside triphosphate pyrophosphohydrolase ham1 [Peltigera leucophlebia]